MRSVRTALLIGLLAWTAAPAHDDILGTRFVASTGTDEGLCDHAHAPCRTIAYAVRNTPGGGTIKQNLYYIRRPGPQSEPPQNGREWDALIQRCIVNARDEIFNTMRGIFEGRVGEQPAPADRQSNPISEDLTRMIREEQLDQKAALKRVARQRGISRSEAYRRLLDERRSSKSE